MRSLAFVPAALALALPAQALMAQAGDPARATVQNLCDGLIATMKAGKRAGARGRAAVIGPVVDRSFDLPLMARLSVGPSWTGLAPADQQAVTTAFRRMTIAQYAKNFDEFSGQSFTIAPQVEARGTDRLVRTTLVSKSEAPVAIAYRLRQSGGNWRIVDVFYKNAVSQIATRRSDFAHTLQTGGAKALVARLNQLAAEAGG
ncbi:ABC transporter substrate-binding protein [Sphingomonas tabacisoli]|uniref:ABC transporter substrate-binding protein n=1 Tax=Sphingomonas tabacisoli TaxID=2249466 RepID=A0ABW4I6S1_9SPHN